MFTVCVRFIALVSTLKYLSNFIKMLCTLSTVYIGKAFCKTSEKLHATATPAALALATLKEWHK